MASTDTNRQKSLLRFFVAALRDKTKINSIKQASLFIEALAAHEDISEAAAQIIDFPEGRKALSLALCQDTSAKFIGEHSATVLKCLSSAELSAINQGQTQFDVLLGILKPSYFFVACIDHLKARALPTDATIHAAWFVSQALRILSADDLAVHVPALTDPAFANSIQLSESPATRSHGYEIKARLDRLLNSDTVEGIADGPGGRHDNDAKSVRDIALFPTQDEILSTKPAFLRTSEEVFGLDVEKRNTKTYFDHLFRLLREDLMHSFREILQPSDGATKRNLLIIPQTSVTGISAVDVVRAKPWKWEPWALQFTAIAPVPGTEGMNEKQRRTFLSDLHGRGAKVLRMSTLMAICYQGSPFGFGSVQRDPDLLARAQPIISLRLDQGGASTIFHHISMGAKFDLIQVDAPTFAYEPFLSRLQSMEEISFSGLLLHKEPVMPSPSTTSVLESMVRASHRGDLSTLRSLFENPTLDLDESQRAALTTGLSQKIAIIQGPPGTGKSFIGSLIARALHDNLAGPMLVICFTNHALDQFAEDLMEIGIPQDSIVRLGAKSSVKTAPLLLRNMQQQSGHLSRSQWGAINARKPRLSSDRTKLVSKLAELQTPVSFNHLLQHLEFLDDQRFFECFSVPDDDNGMKTVGSKGKAIARDYLFRRWYKGAKDAGVLTKYPSIGQSTVWKLPNEARKSLYSEWTTAIKADLIEDFRAAGQSFDAAAKSTRKTFRSLDSAILASKKIIACTSTQAAMSADILSSVKPETVLLEEAGELLEPHVLTALSQSTQRLIMIGDEKQLRPKIANYALSVECGKGFDLNRSLFERLILDGFDHVGLQKQHRMRPEISGLVRHMTYPDLEDAESTRNRPSIKGLQQNVVFINHHEPEVARVDVLERRSGSSKENPYEAKLALRYVKYLAQQGYKSSDVIVLTPYLAQLRVLQDTLNTENDAILNDPDSNDLYQAGLLDSTKAKSSGRQIAISSIDNYQGEERKIVIISLTRSNDAGSIGFMAEPERLNVLLSRARDGMIVIGNFDTFTASPKGGEMWQKLLTYAKDRGFVCDGLPVQCQVHPDVKMTLTGPDDFAKKCPDGGCSARCDVTLPCGQHKCPLRCHPDRDHSSHVCNEVVKSHCDQGHVQTRRCNSRIHVECPTCQREEDKRKRLAEKLIDEIDKSEAGKKRHESEMDSLDVEINHVQEQLANLRIEHERAKQVALKKDDLTHYQQRLDQARSGAQPSARPINTSVSNASAANAARSDTKNSNNQDRQEKTSPAFKFDTQASSAQGEWERQKREENQKNAAIDELMAFIGLESVKQTVLDLKAQIETEQRQGIDVAEDRLHVTFLGNPGTGKTSVARLWAKILFSLKALEGKHSEATTGSKLAHDGISGAKKHLDDLEQKDGGVFFIDEAYQLTSGTNPGGKPVLDFLLDEIETRRGRICFVFAGYKDPMQTFYAHNPGIRSRIPHSFEFHDYTEGELHAMLTKLFAKRFDDRAKIEDGADGLYMRIVSRRLSRQRGNEGFGNMRDLENIFARICSRQSRRINDSRRQGISPDDFEFSGADLIGPEPSEAVLESPSWKKLGLMIGLSKVKENVKVLLDTLKTNYERELLEKEPLQVSLNKVMLGNPGTGKTSVAKLYGRILADIGLLSNGDVVVKTPSDFIGSVIGGTEERTRGILEASKGKVLVIDEAYMFASSERADGGPARPDIFRTAAIDTIVSQVHNVPGDDRCILLLGYEAKMETMFRDMNPGLSRRFPLADAFRFSDFDDDELLEILRVKLRQQDLEATGEGERVAIECLGRARSAMHFGNAGEVDNLLTRAKLNRQKRITPDGNYANFTLDAIDFDPDYDRAKSAADRIDDLFRDHIGFEQLAKQLKTYQRVVENLKKADLPIGDKIPFNWVFRGPPGTGKTTTARKIGQVYYDMGVLQRGEVVETSASDLIGGYIGQTALKTRALVEKALGKILFIDEAYRLGDSRNPFAKEATDELTGLLTKEEYHNKLIVILAGYDTEMNQMLSVNPGLKSRFPDSLLFKALTPTQCLDLFISQLTKSGLSCPSLDDTSSTEAEQIATLLEKFTEHKSWGNARDVQTIGKKVIQSAYGRIPAPDEDIAVLPHPAIKEVLETELAARAKSEGLPAPVQSGRARRLAPMAPAFGSQSAPPPAAASTKQDTKDAETDSEDDQNDGKSSSVRDPGVSDAVWAQLQASIANEARAAADNKKALANLKSASKQAQDDVEDCEQKLQTLKLDKDDGPGSNSEDGNDSAAPDHAVDTEREKLLKEVDLLREARRLAEEKRRREEERQAEERKKKAAVQQRIKDMDLCPMGFQWFPQGGGYRCGGGSHWLSNDQLGL